MRTKRRVSVVCGAIVSVWIAQPVSAQISANDLTRVVRSGMNIRVYDERGEVIKGQVESASIRAIDVRTGDVTLRVVLKDVARIQEVDTVKDGAAVGFVIGAIVGAVSGSADKQGTGHRGRFVSRATAIGGVVWMGYGAAIDALHRKVIYRRPKQTVSVRPVLRPGTLGVAWSLAWDSSR